MSISESATSGAIKGIMPYALLGGGILAIYLYRDKIAAWIAGLTGGFAKSISEGIGNLNPLGTADQWSTFFQQQTQIWKDAQADDQYFQSLVNNPNAPTVADDIIANKPPTEWIDANNPLLPGWSMTIVNPAQAQQQSIPLMDSVMGLQGIGLSETIVSEVTPTLSIIDRTYTAPGVSTQETVFQDAWSGIIGPNLTAQNIDKQQQIADCLSRGGGWNWNTRECSL